AGDEAAATPALTVEMLCEAGLSLKQASAVVARLGGRSRREIYQDALAARRTRRHGHQPDDNADDNADDSPNDNQQDDNQDD
ncbi:MAG: hypothetical protein ACXWN9_01110, partial [Candidatus Binataceae bacterium]